MDIEMIDLTLRLREALPEARRESVETSLHALNGVLSTHVSGENPNIMVVEINPARIHSDSVLEHLAAQGVPADLAVPERL